MAVWYKTPGFYRLGLNVGTNTAKKYAVALQFNQRTSVKYGSNSSQAYLNNQYRFTDRLSVGLDNNLELVHKDAGFAFISNAGDSVLFGLRNRTTVENVFHVKYNFNIKMGLSFRARHYWSEVHYTRFLNLGEDGYLEDVASVNQNPDKNVNLFNIDMVYTWQFASGSFINIAWKDAGLLLIRM